MWNPIKAYQAKQKIKADREEYLFRLRIATINEARFLNRIGNLVAITCAFVLLAMIIYTFIKRIKGA